MQKNSFKLQFIGGLLALLGGYASYATAKAELKIDETCTVSILNRAVQANDRGRFALPNVPSFMGQVRARATCIRDGKTVSAQTNYFSVETDGAVDVGAFYLAEEEKVPVRLDLLHTPPIRLFDLDDTAQLDVGAIYPNKTFSDVSFVETGINFTSSNPAVVSVDASGTLRALSSGSALITARKDGAIAVINTVVAIGGDKDVDGIPDDVELANGLDPNDPVDAHEDADNDGISNLDEFQKKSGTSITPCPIK